MLIWKGDPKQRKLDEKLKKEVFNIKVLLQHLSPTLPVIFAGYEPKKEVEDLQELCSMASSYELRDTSAFILWLQYLVIQLANLKQQYNIDYNSSIQKGRIDEEIDKQEHRLVYTSIELQRDLEIRVNNLINIQQNVEEHK